MEREQVRLECLKLATPSIDAALAVGRAKIYEEYILGAKDEPASKESPAAQKAVVKPSKKSSGNSSLLD